MLLVLLIGLFDLRDLPSNEDNWGRQTQTETYVNRNSKPNPVKWRQVKRLAIVDFSFGRDGPFHSYDSTKLFNSDVFFSGLRRTLFFGLGAFHTAKDLSTVIVERRFRQKYGEWFKSRQSFRALLDVAMGEVCAWLSEDRLNQFERTGPAWCMSGGLFNEVC